MSSAAQATPSDDGHRRFQPASVAVAVLILTVILVTGVLGLVRYAGVRDNVDLATYSQAVWNTAHGDPFRTSVLPFTENYLGNHFTPILALFVPLYLLWSDSRVLLLLQVIVAALAVLPLFWFAREHLPSPWAGVLLAAAYVLYPAFQHQILTDFHGVILGAAVVMWAYFALLTKRNLLLFCLLPLMFLVREELSLLIITMGLYALLFQRRWRLGLFLFVLGVAASALVILVLIPSFRGGRSFHYGEYYAYLGDSPLAMARRLLLQPRLWVPRAVFVPKLKLLAQLLLPVAFLPLLAPSVFLLGSSALAYLLLVDYPFHQIYILDGHYQALLVPFIFYGTVMGIARLASWLGPRWGETRVTLVASCLVLLLCLVTASLWSPLADETRRAEFRVDEQSRAEQALLSQIPPEAGVVSDERFAAALSTREGYYLFGGLYEHEYPIEYLIFEDTPIGFPAHPPALLGAPGIDGWQVPRWELLGRAGQTELMRQRGMLGAVPLPQAQGFVGVVAPQDATGVVAPQEATGAVALRGATGYGEPLVAVPGEQLEVALVWENQGAAQPRLVPFLHLIQRQGETQYRWASVDREPYGGLFPTDLWPAGSLVGDLYILDLPPYLAPGEYELHAGLYTREGQQRLALADGSTTALTGVVIVSEATAGDRLPEVPIRLDVPLAEGLVLYGQNPVPEQAGPGGTVDVTLYWQATDLLSQAYGLRFDLVPEGGTEPVTAWQRTPAGDGYPATDWQPGAVVAGWYPLTLPADLAPGRYHLLVTAASSGEPAGQPAPLVALDILD